MPNVLIISPISYLKILSEEKRKEVSLKRIQ